ncbi:hypothetical protein DY000_02024133 [Brassica cretica]|uniref:CASP-like protein n=1 Tax=Brassica cretica TaxID=69181 RepID=A0ABQ7E0J8_BRACR|nr:hypothetical protein DY000_02024133 [Brassica cretica]
MNGTERSSKDGVRQRGADRSRVPLYQNGEDDGYTGPVRFVVASVSDQSQRPATSDCDMMLLIVVRLKVARLIAAVVAMLFISMSRD